MPPLAASLRLLLIGLHLVSGALQAALLFPLGGGPWRRRLKRIWSQHLLALLGIRIETVGFDFGRIEGGLLVANHISFIDIFVINALLPSAFVAKDDVARWPLIGWLSRRTGTVFIERGSRKAAHRTHQQMQRTLAAGSRVAIFPEGTSTAGDRLLPFHAALFQSAIDAAVPLHAIALSYHHCDGTPSAAPAYIGEISLLECMLSVLQAGRLVARITLAASFTPPLADRRHLAHCAHHAVAAALAKPGAPDCAQPLRNEAAINT